MLNDVGAPPLFRTIRTMEPSELWKATDSKLPWSKVFDWMRTAPEERNLLAWEPVRNRGSRDVRTSASRDSVAGEAGRTLDSAEPDTFSKPSASSLLLHP